VAVLESPSIVLRAIDFGESDRVITMLARTLGCVSALARGARKSQKRFSGGLGLCAMGTAAFRERGGSELLTLERFELSDQHASLSGDVLRMAHAAYAAELLSKLCAPRQSEPGCFDLMKAFLDVLETNGPGAASLRVFELALLDQLGFAPVLDACAVCGRDDLSVGSEIDARWSPERGGIVCLGCGGRGRSMRPIVRLALVRYASSSLSEIAGDKDEIRPDVAAGCRDAMAEIIASHVSAPLRSLEFLAKMESTLPGAAES